MEATTAAGIQDQFLNLLTTQLRHQDPLEPTKQEDFIAQLAQFSTLEGIEELNQNFSEFMASQQNANQDSPSSGFQNIAHAAGLVGKRVSFAVAQDNVGGASEEAGVVEAVVLENDTINLRIGDDLIPFESIREISAATNYSIGLP